MRLGKVVAGKRPLKFKLYLFCIFSCFYVRVRTKMFFVTDLENDIFSLVKKEMNELKKLL